ncbi:retrovirus-related pol polyprotein from transposon TNT 1-94 [Tanacetum coccineum]
MHQAMTGMYHCCAIFVKNTGTVRIGNDQFAPIHGIWRLVQGNITITEFTTTRRYIKHNPFSVGQLCDADLEKQPHQLQSVSWLKPHQLKHGSDIEGFPHLNFRLHQLLSKKNIVIGLPKLKYVKDQLCSSCEVSKAKRSSFKSKTVPSSKGRLNLLHMDLCGPMRVASINGKKYIRQLTMTYSRYTCTLFSTFQGTEFLNKTLNAFFKEEGIEHQTSTPRTPEQKGVVER